MWIKANKHPNLVNEAINTDILERGIFTTVSTIVESYTYIYTTIKWRLNYDIVKQLKQIPFK